MPPRDSDRRADGAGGRWLAIASVMVGTMLALSLQFPASGIARLFALRVFACLLVAAMLVRVAAATCDACHAWRVRRRGTCALLGALALAQAVIAVFALVVAFQPR